jgi:hypothetical protein
MPVVKMKIGRVLCLLITFASLANPAAGHIPKSEPSEIVKQPRLLDYNGLFFRQ